MAKPHVKRTVSYFLVLVFGLLLLFFSNDFNLTDVQKTAVVMAVGVDREDDVFIVTSQIAVPQESKQGKQTETVELVSRGKTVADAFEEINAKTGWYPKLVFCHLIVLGEKTVEKDVFDALDFFFLDEYLSDNCLLATCQGTAKDLLNTAALIDPSASVAMQKVLSPHAERVGSVLPSTLREFAIGYFSDSKSGYLPILKTQPQQEKIGNEPSQNGQGGQSGQESQGGGQGLQGDSKNDTKSGQGGQKSQSGGEKSGQTDKPVFSAGETALFVAGKKVGEFSKEETFAFNAVKTQLKLAPYTVEKNGSACTLNIKNNSAKTKFSLSENGKATLNIQLSLLAGLLDSSSALAIKNAKDAGDIPIDVFPNAESLLKEQIQSAFEKSRACGCDVFELRSILQKKHAKKYTQYQDTVLQSANLEISVRFKNVR